MTKDEYKALKPGDKVRAIGPDWFGDWPGCIIIAQEQLPFFRESDRANCYPEARHIELYVKAKTEPLPLPG